MVAVDLSGASGREGSDEIGIQGGRARTATRAGQGSAISGTCRLAKEQRLKMASAGSIGAKNPDRLDALMWGALRAVFGRHAFPVQSLRR